MVNVQIIEPEEQIIEPEGEKQDVFDKLRVFDSKVSYDFPLSVKGTNYFFANVLEKLPTVVGHLSKVWEEEYNKAAYHAPFEEIVANDIKQCQKDILDKEKLLRELITNAVNTDFQVLRTLASQFKDPELEENNTITENLRSLIEKKEESPSIILKKITKILTEQQRPMETSEKDFLNEITKCYHYYWHSEQRLINYLLTSSSDSWWESLREEIYEGRTLKGILLHLHSRYNFCKTCRYTLARCGLKDSRLFKRIMDQLNIKDEIFFKIMGSFRVHYSYTHHSYTKDQYPLWMPYKQKTEEQTEFQTLLFGSNASFYIQRIYCKTEEEEREDKKAEILEQITDAEKREEKLKEMLTPPKNQL